MKTILFIIFLLSGYLCLAAPLQEKGQTVKVVNIDSVYQKQMVEMSGKIQAMERELDSIGAVNRDLLFSRELYSDLISTQLFWFGSFMAVLLSLFGLINFGFVSPKLKEFKKEQDEYKVSSTQMIEKQSMILEEKFNQLITDQKTAFKEEIEKRDKIIRQASLDACRGMYFEAERMKDYENKLCWSIAVIKEIIKSERINKNEEIKCWIKISEENNNLITDPLTEDNYTIISGDLNEISDIIDEIYKERIKTLQENINIKYYSLLDKTKKKKPKN